MTRIVGTVSCLLLAFITASEAQPQPSTATVHESEIATAGRGEVRLAPDFAFVTRGVTTQSPSGKVIDAAINAGATDVSSIQYMPTSSEEARRTALASAVQQARSDADAMARAAGDTLGHLLSMNTNGIAQPMLRGVGLESVVLTSGGGSMPTQITHGELNVVAMVFAVGNSYRADGGKRSAASHVYIVALGWRDQGCIRARFGPSNTEAGS